MIYFLFLDDKYREHRNPDTYCRDSLQIPFRSQISKKIGDMPWILVDSYEEFETALKKHGIPYGVSFDHDLGIGQDGTEKTGKDCATLLAYKCLDEGADFPHYFIHTDNIPGRDNIQSVIDSFIKVKNM